MKNLIFEMPVLDEIISQLAEIDSKLEEIKKEEPQNRWLTNAEACEFLQVTPRTTQNYRDKGIISFSQVGSKIYYKQSDLENHLEAN